MPIVNGHPVETGCYIDGHWGQYGPDRLAEIAEEFGMELTPETDPRAWRGGQSEDDPNVGEYITFALDEIERWLNDHTPSICAGCGQEYDCHSDDARCEDDRRLSFVWHWSDGEFFLSPICENGDCDDDTCAHWD